MSGFLAVSHLTVEDKIPTDFHSQMICGVLFPAMVLWAEVPGMVLRPLTFQGGSLQLRYPSGFRTAVYVGARPSLFTAVPFLQILAVASSVYPWF